MGNIELWHLFVWLLQQNLSLCVDYLRSFLSHSFTVRVISLWQNGLTFFLRLLLRREDHLYFSHAWCINFLFDKRFKHYRVVCTFSMKILEFIGWFDVRYKESNLLWTRFYFYLWHVYDSVCPCQKISPYQFFCRQIKSRHIEGGREKTYFLACLNFDKISSLIWCIIMSDSSSEGTASYSSG